MKRLVLVALMVVMAVVLFFTQDLIVRKTGMSKGDVVMSTATPFGGAIVAVKNLIQRR